MELNGKPWRTILAFVLLTEAVGALSGWLTRAGTEHFKNAVNKPPLSPPAAVFPIVWAVLFALMGISAALVYLSPASRARTLGLQLYWVQLGFNFLWSILFFNLRNYPLAFGWLAVLWGLIVWMALTFHEVRPAAAWMQAPYLLWVLFAGYLNWGVYKLNP